MAVVWLDPIDTSGTGLPDAWRALYFGDDPVDPKEVTASGMTIEEHYWAGTNPTNPASFLGFYELPEPVEGEFILTWPVVSGRSYLVQRATDLVAQDWMPVYGPITAVVGETEMNWKDTNLLGHHVYRVLVLPPLLP
jgi:hypothetical protein